LTAKEIDAFHIEAYAAEALGLSDHAPIAQDLDLIGTIAQTESAAQSSATSGGGQDSY
jgi:hypothetical protein